MRYTMGFFKEFIIATRMNTNASCHKLYLVYVLPNYNNSFEALKKHEKKVVVGIPSIASYLSHWCCTFFMFFGEIGKLLGTVYTLYEHNRLEMVRNYFTKLMEWNRENT